MICKQCNLSCLHWVNHILALNITASLWSLGSNPFIIKSIVWKCFKSVFNFTVHTLSKPLSPPCNWFGPIFGVTLYWTPLRVNFAPPILFATRPRTAPKYGSFCWRYPDEGNEQLITISKKKTPQMIDGRTKIWKDGWIFGGL